MQRRGRRSNVDDEAGVVAAASTPPRVRGVYMPPVVAAPAVRAATPHLHVAAAGAKPPRPQWPDICDCLWKILGCGMGRKDRSRGSVVADSSSTQGHVDEDEVRNDRDEGKPQAARSLATLGDGVGKKAGPPSENAEPPYKRENQAWYHQRDPRPRPLRVGRLIVSDEELALYAMYCQDSATYMKQVVCHMCVFDDQKYHANHFDPDKIVPHCSRIHLKLGLKCDSCRVRVSTERDRTLHTEFCHRLASGWWNSDEYEHRLQRHYKAVEKRMRPC